MNNKFLEEGINLFTKKYSPNNTPERWNNTKLIEHSEIGILKIVMKNVDNKIATDFTVNLSIWFDPHVSTIEYVLYNRHSKEISHNETKFEKFSYENIVNAIKVILIIFIRDVKKQNFEIIEVKY